MQNWVEFFPTNDKLGANKQIGLKKDQMIDTLFMRRNINKITLNKKQNLEKSFRINDKTFKFCIPPSYFAVKL